MKMKDNTVKSVLILTVILFSAGLVLGAVALFYIPEEIVSEVREGFDFTLNSNCGFVSLFKKNFSFEIIWVIIIWLLGNMSFTAPLSVGVVSARGFLIGFGVSFIFMFCENKLHLILGSILPQAIFALSSITALCVMTVRLSVEKRAKQGTETSQLVIGTLFLLVTAVVAALESGCAVFINM